MSGRRGWVALLGLPVVAVLLVVTVVAVTLAGASVETDEADQRGECRVVTTDPSRVTVAGLDEVQVAHAVTIVEVGLERELPTQALRVALAVAAQESMFRNYANDGTGELRPDQRDVDRSLRYPHDAVGRDHGSVNVFQQQYPWWGSLDELMDPPTAAGKFFDALVDVPGWESLPITVAAQRVQRSAFPTAYAKWESLADEILAAVLRSPGEATAPGPGAPSLGAPLPGPSGPAAAGGAADPCEDRAVPAGFTPLAGADAGEVAVNIAASWIGTPYSWGGGTRTGPSLGIGPGAGTVGFDCSGLILHAWYQAAGVELPHSSRQIAAITTPVSIEQAQAGDILSFATRGGRVVSHDGLYDGRGGMVHAPRKGKTVEHVPDVLESEYWSSRLVSITRPAVPESGG
ncbi:MAG: C40 family peptidase [Kineosporiaceae bacterium]